VAGARRWRWSGLRLARRSHLPHPVLARSPVLAPLARDGGPLRPLGLLDRTALG